MTLFLFHLQRLTRVWRDLFYYDFSFLFCTRMYLYIDVCVIFSLGALPRASRRTCECSIDIVTEYHFTSRLSNKYLAICKHISEHLSNCSHFALCEEFKSYLHSICSDEHWKIICLLCVLNFIVFLPSRHIPTRVVLSSEEEKKTFPKRWVKSRW